MDKVKEINARITKHKEAIIKLETEKEKLSPWVPTIGDTYYVIFSDGLIYTEKVHSSNSFDTLKQRIGYSGVFRTKEQAEQRRELIRKFVQSLYQN